MSPRIFRPSHPKPLAHPVINLPLEAFWGIAEAESSFNTFAIGPDGFDHGLWQVRSFYNQERGIVNAFDPIETTRWAAKNFQKNLAYFRNIDKAITSHKRGRGWTDKKGIDRKYVKRVKEGL